MKPKLEILPPSQKALWPLLATVPSQFTLYGGTAIALQLGHRLSVDFDFFSALSLDRETLLLALPFLKDTHWVQPEINTLNCQVEINHDPVKLQFLAGLDTRQGRVEDPLICEDNGIKIASLRDLLASKLNTIQMRAEIKDYIDIDAMLQSNLTLTDGLACARAVFGPRFDIATSIRALCSYRDGDLAQLSSKIRDRLIQAALTVDQVPEIKPKSATI